MVAFWYTTRTEGPETSSMEEPGLKRECELPFIRNWELMCFNKLVFPLASE